MYILAALAAQTPPIALPNIYLVELPKDYISFKNPMGLKYRFITVPPDYTLSTGDSGLQAATIQFDCCGYDSASSVVLAYALRKVFKANFRGPLLDPDATFVDSIFRLPTCVDGYSDTNRTYVRSLEYVVNYIQT